MRGRCNACHFNGGANFDLTNKNRNFDTKTRTAQQFPDVPFFAGVFLFDGGFGGKGLAQPNFPTLDVNGPDVPDINNGFGNGSFSTPPVIEAADTMPAFHTNAFGAGNFIEGVVGFYASDVFFLSSPAAAELNARFGAPVNITGDDISNIGRFLRALNVALNLDMAKQRLRASQTILNGFHDQHAEIQKQLIRLAREELDDALAVLTRQLHAAAVLSGERRSHQSGEERDHRRARRREFRGAPGAALERDLAGRERARSAGREHHLPARTGEPDVLSRSAGAGGAVSEAPPDARGA